jgi:DNA polymerase-3 subunit alpha
MMRKRGDNIAFVQLQDGSGRLETAFFTEAYAEFGGMLQAGEIIVVEGVASWDEFNGGAQLRVRRAWPLADACQHHARGLSISVRNPAPDFAADLKRTLAPWRGGGIGVRLRYRRGPASVELEFADNPGVCAPIPALPALLLQIPGVLSAEWVFNRRIAESEAA